MTGPHYYVQENDKKIELANHENIVTYFQRCKEDEGEFLTDYSGVKVSYNLLNGGVFLTNDTNHRWIANFYAPAAFQALTKPIEEAISALAKCLLLLELHAYGDEEISALIKRNHLHPETGDLVNNHTKMLDQTLHQIKKLAVPSLSHLYKPATLTPTQKLVSNVLKEYKNDINAKQDCHEILALIKDKMRSANKAEIRLR